MSWSEIAVLSRASGVPHNTILNIKKRTTTNPGVRTVEALLAASKRRRVKAAA